ncbi:amidohydrolase [Labedella endophytica]|uniref:Amidohydrolase n=1 Tax=Labedella endophytica TaxID=1523160 RepID=A0A433JWL8_9MICO|nr:amidohydrolase [Labedella endophytica]RUR03395.1 amidohydrolase [Labedella endophytica]
MTTRTGRTDMTFHSGVVRTSDPDAPLAEAVAVVDGRIAAVGSTTDVLAATSSDTRVVDLGGASVTPGLIDSHLHPLWGARLSAGIDLEGVATLEGVRAAIAAEAARLEEGEWVRGWNLDYVAFDGAAPHRAVLDEAAGGRPVLLMFYDLHTALASEVALAAAGIDGPREFGDASSIVVDSAGVLTGELREPSAYDLVVNAAPAPSLDDDCAMLRATFRDLAAVGLTGCAVMDGSVRLLDVLERMEETADLGFRLDVFLWHRPEDDDAAVEATIAAGRRSGRSWRVAGIKLFSDGVIDTGTAWLHEPDTCGAGRAGFWPDWDRYRAVIRRYDEAGLQLATHAVGDGAVSAVLDAYAELPPAVPERPRRIEHLEVLSDADVEQLRGTGVVASMQPLHMQWRHADLSDSWATRLGAERAATGFRARDVLDAGVPTVFGSDWPVASFDPRTGLAWACARTAPGAVAVGDGADAAGVVFEPEQRVSVEDALVAYTRSAALALGDPDRGVLRLGAVADLVVWDVDPATVAPTALGSIAIRTTMVGGVLTHDRPAPA